MYLYSMDIVIPAHKKIYLKPVTFKIIQASASKNVKFNMMQDLRKTTLQREHWKLVNYLAKKELIY